MGTEKVVFGQLVAKAGENSRDYQPHHSKTDSFIQVSPKHILQNNSSHIIQPPDDYSSEISGG
jgi:hypothetical protein